MLVKSSRRSRSHHKKHNNKKYKKHTMRKTHSRNHKKSHSRKSMNKSRRHTKHQKGGFSDCALATVQESGFSIPDIGDVPGFSLPDSKGVIYRPNCKSDSYQAMVPL